MQSNFTDLPAKLIALPTKNGKVWVSYQQIRYLATKDGLTTIHLQEGEAISTKRLATWERLLDHRFMRTSRNHLVNLEHVVSVGQNHVVLSNGEQLPLSVRQARKLHQHM